MQEIIDVISNNGIGLICAAVVVYDHLVNQKKTIEVMEKITEALHSVCNRLNKIEDKLEIESEENPI